MVGRNKRKDDDQSSSSTDDEVLASIKKKSSSKKNGSNIKKSLGKARRKYNKSSESDKEPDYQLTSDDSLSEVKTRNSKDTSDKRRNGRSNKKETVSRTKRIAETRKKRSVDRTDTSRHVDSSSEDSEKSDAEEKNGKESPKKESSRKRETKPKKSKKEPEEEYEVEEILDFKIEDKMKYFFVRWKGYDSSVDSWVWQRDLHCKGLIEQFYDKRPEARISTHKRRKNVDSFMPRKRNKVQITFKRELKIDELPDYDSEAFDENQEWKVEKIVDVRYHRGNKRDFLIRWEGFSSKSDSWEPEENLDCKELIKKFMAKLEDIANATVKELRPVRKPTQRYTLMDVTKGRRLSKRLDGRQRAAYYDCE